MRTLYPKTIVAGSILAGLITASVPLHAQGQGPGRGGTANIEAGQPNVILHPTVDMADRLHSNNGNGSGKGGGRKRVTTSNNLAYGGGIAGIGVETAPKLYLVLWGAQWTNNDPSGEAALLQAFYGAAGGSAWLNSVAQYCQGVAKGTVFCNGSGTPAGNPTGILAGVWYDSAFAAPARPKQSDLAAEAVKAASHFGNTAAGSNANIQYVIATASGNNSTGFGSQYCAYHSSTSSTSGYIAYTNLPYITDAGGSCGANFNNLGFNAGITIVSGHEMAETITDQFPNGGWLDGQGEENGDKCAWIRSGQGASAYVTLTDNNQYPVQSLWSNAFASATGGCVLQY